MKADGFKIIETPFEGLNQFARQLHTLYQSSVEDAECYDTVAFIPEFQRLFASPKILSAVRDAMGLSNEHPLYLWAGRCRIDRAGDERRTYGWHQEKFYGPPEASRGIQLWAPLFCEREIDVLPGSHDKGVFPQDWYENKNGAHQILVNPEIVDRFTPTTVKVAFGDALLFDSMLVHRSVPHHTGTRFTIIGRFFDPIEPNFIPPKPSMEYRGDTPRDAYDKWRLECGL